MVDLAVTNAKCIAPAIDALPWSSSRIEAQLDKLNLSPLLAYEQSGLIPLESAAKFIFLSGEALGEATYGYESIARFSDGDQNQIIGVPLPLGQTSLRTAKAFVSELNGAISNVQFFYQLSKTRFWIFRSTKTTSVSETWALTLYNLTAVLTGMRRIFGNDLRPAAMDVGMSEYPQNIPEAYRDIPIRIGRKWIGLGFDLQDLIRRENPARHFVQTGIDQGVEFTHLTAATPDTVTACIHHLLTSGRTDRLAERVAAGFGASLRGYQRKLLEMGVSHTELRDRARLMAAMESLNDDKKSVTTIAMDLGYAHAGDFTRFFKAQTGQTPSAFRNAS